MTRRAYRVRILAILFLTVAAVCAWGCRRGNKRAIGPSADSEVQVAKRDHFGMAVQYLFDIDATQRASDEAIYHLNRWALQKHFETDWVRDPLIGRLMPELRNIKELRLLDRIQFKPEDRSYIEAAWWLHSIARLALEQPLASEQATWIAHQQLTSADRKALQEACQLFDWTVRHIYLDTLLPYPKITSAGPRVTGGDSSAPAPFPSMRGEPGPGYRFLPLQTLLAGRGDSLNRARIMLLLCRQLGLPAFVLGVDPGGTPRPRPWLCAVLIGQDLYLFDPEWGMALPASDPGSVATLRELRGDPQWPARLKSGDHDYPHHHEDLDKIVALIDASPEALSQRMAALEQALPTKHSIKLTVQPTKLAQRLIASDSYFGESGRVRIWNMPLEAVIFQQHYREYVNRFPQTARQDAQALIMLQQLPLLQQARRLHALGYYNDTGEKPGAKSLYLEARTPDALLEQLPGSPSLQRQFGLERGDREPPQQFAQRVLDHINMRKQAKYLASYWLSQAHYDSGMIDVAVNWFKDRTLDAFPDGELNAGAQYNLARCYEALGQLESAIPWLEATSWPQRFGDRLRAEMLRRQAKASPSQPAE